MESSNLLDLVKNPDKILDLQFNQISDILKSADEILTKENLLLEFNIEDKEQEVYIVGDIHGNLLTLTRILEIIKKRNPKLIIFLGDIVDRGPKQFECLILILALKILYPEKYFILKGNHETLEMNQYYGFVQEFLDKFEDSERFYEILSIYDVIPYCAIINEKILCLHGGIPEDFNLLKKIKGLKPKDINKEVLKSISHGLYQIMWNDPKEVGDLEFSNSFRGPGIKFFGEKAFKRFMNAYNFLYLIRAHECFPEGYRWFFQQRLLSIFSSANYRGIYSPNPASYAIIKNNNVYPELVEIN